MTQTRTRLLRAAGGLFVVSGLCIFVAPSFAGTSKTGKQSTTSSHSATNSTAKKPASSSKPVSASAKNTKKKPTSRSARSRMQMAPTPDRIKEIQSALAESDSYKGEPTGKWDDASIAALKHFQQVNGLNPTGKLDAHSLQKLGLGSDTAGRGAPRPGKPATLSSSSTSPAIQR